MNKRQISRRAALALAAAVGLISATQSSAQVTPEVLWDGGGTPGATGDWSVASNWNPDVVPSNTDVNPGNDPIIDAQFVQINDGGTAVIGSTSTTFAAQAPFLMLGLRPGDVGHLEINAGSSLTAGEIRVGGRESINDAITNTPGDDWATTTNYTFNAGGTGSVLQKGGDVFVNFEGLNFDPDGAGTEGSKPIQSLYIGDSGINDNSPVTRAKGTYEIQAGQLISGVATDDAIVIGTGFAEGDFIQSGGDVVSSGFVIVGRRLAIATYTMSGGTLDVGVGPPAGGQDLNIGDGDAAGLTGTSGTFTQTAGTVTVNNDVQLARRSGTAVYDITGGSLEMFDGSLALGRGEASGSLMQGVATFHLGGTGLVTIGDSGAASTSVGNFNVGLTSGSVSGGTMQGTFNMDGGTLSMTDAAAVWAVGNGIGAVGDANISAGTATMSGASAILCVGRNSGTGTFDLTGGTVNVNTATASEVSIGHSQSTGTLNISASGVLNARSIQVGGSSTTAPGGATAGNGTLNVLPGGDLNVTNITIVSSAAAQTRKVNISGGTVDVSTFNNGAGAGGGVGGLVREVNISGGVTNITTATAGINVVWNVTAAADLTVTTFTGAGDAANVTGALNLTGGTTKINNLLLNRNTLYIDGGGAFTIASGLYAGTFTLSSNGTLKTDNNITMPSTIQQGSGTINVNTGSLALTGPITTGTGQTLTKIGPGTLTISGTQSHVNNSGFTNNAGTLNFNATVTNATAGVGHYRMTANNSGTVTNLNATSYRLQQLNSNSGATINFAANPTPLATSNVINTDSVAIAGGKINLENNKLVTRTAAGTLTGTDYNGVTGMVQDGYAAGAWTGNGLVTSQTAAAAPTLATTLAVAPNSAIGKSTFGGVAVTAADTLVMYTWNGDANLSGTVDADDYFAIDSNYNKSGTVGGFNNGDFNYDGVIDGADYFLIDSGFSGQNAVFPSAPLGGVSAVPEPASIALLALGALGVFPRRRRR